MSSMSKTHDWERLGSDLAAKMGWNGVSVLMVAIEALTAANFHREASILDHMVDALNEANGEREIGYELTIKDIEDGIPF